MCAAITVCLYDRLNDVSIVSGNGIGRLTAHRFAKLGCTVVVWDVNAEWNEETATQLRQYGVPVYAYTCDLCKRDEIYRIAEQVRGGTAYTSTLTPVKLVNGVNFAAIM